MTEASKAILGIAEDKMNKTLDFLNETLLSIRAGKASPNVLKGITVDYYGVQTPVDQIVSVNIPDAKTINIQPWDRNMIGAIEKAIINANIGMTPSNNGESIRLNVPVLTEERRKELVKQVRSEAENARVGMRNARRDAVDAFKKARKDGMPEDEAKGGEDEAQKLIDKMSKKLDEMVAKKEKEIMTV